MAKKKKQSRSSSMKFKLKKNENRIVSIFMTVWVIYFLIIYLSIILGYAMELVNLTVIFGNVDASQWAVYGEGIFFGLIYAGVASFFFVAIEGFVLSLIILVFSAVIEIFMHKKIDFANTLALLFAVSIVISFVSTSVAQIQTLFAIGLLIVFILLAVGIID